ncbi:MAG: hypothetical protein AABY07_05195, partial [Nanoarchaeota archaeon]
MILIDEKHNGRWINYVTNNDYYSRIKKAVTPQDIAAARQRGLVPQSGDWNAPDKWIRPQESSTLHQKPIRSIEEVDSKQVLWHGTPSGELRGGARGGLHIGTHKAALQALNATIGTPVLGNWDGNRKYGETLLAGRKTLLERGEGYTGYNADSPEEDHYPTGKAKYSDGTLISLNSKPVIFPVRITGEMVNSQERPYGDTAANARMHGQMTRNQAKRGYYYKNISEDEGSISAVVPNRNHLEILRAPNIDVSFVKSIAKSLDKNNYEIKIGNRQFSVEIAKDHELGLGNRDELQKN